MIKIEIKRKATGFLKKQKYYARIIATNGEELWRTSEKYCNLKDVEHACELIADLREVTIYYDWKTK